MSWVHAAIGFAIVGGFFLLFVWGGITYLLRREPSRWFWWTLAGLQGVLIAQVLVGIVLLVVGRRNQLLHYAYGGLFPAIVLVVTHVVARGMDEERLVPAVFAAGSFIAFGLTLRALATGLGIG